MGHFYKLATQEKLELGLVALASVGLFLWRGYLPVTYLLGSLMAVLALTLLLHGFVRDLFLLYQQKRGAGGGEPRALRCMCLESTIGLPAVILAVLLSVVLPDFQIELPQWVSALSFSGVLFFGFAIKDLVLTWRPFSIRREKGHAYITFRL